VIPDKPKTLFNFPKKISAGEIQKYAKGFGFSGRAGLPALGGGAELQHFVLK
jgi:hypothetical protein